MAEIFRIPMVIRGEVIFDDLVPHQFRHLGLQFETPSPSKYLKKLVVADCRELADLYTLKVDDIIDFLVELGDRLAFSKNAYLQEAYEISRLASNLPDSILRYIYEKRLTEMLTRRYLEDLLDAQIGRDYLDGWVPHKHLDGRVTATRAFGSRIATVIPGNVPMGPVTQVMRGALTRCDTIFKTPSNDPASATAVLRTMCDIDVRHPLTRHVSAAYWKGGDETVESVLYRPQFIDKIIVWGGESSIRHARKYLQPGLQVLPFDPKRSCSLIGRDTFHNESTMREAAQRLAADIGGLNQEGCVNARVVYVECGTSKEGISILNRFGQLVYDAVQQLPTHISTVAKFGHPALREHLEDISLYEEFRVIGRLDNSGAIIVSQVDETVEFSHLLEGRTANLVPVDSLDKALTRLNHSSQTIGVYPESIRERVRDRAALFGGQRITSLGYACAFTVASRIDAVEPLRQMCRWIIDEKLDPATNTPLWQNA